MKYLIVQDWKNTSGNHAGMKHLCCLLCKAYPNKYKMIVKESPIVPSQSNSFIKRIWFKIRNSQRFRLEYFTLCKSMFKELKDNDEVFLLEYLLPFVSQREIALYIKKNNPKVRIYGLAHLTPTWFKKNFSSNKIKEWIKPIDKVLTLGTSLSAYFEDIGIPSEMINTGFHYVDNEYYQTNLTLLNSERKPTIIAQGFLQRDFSLLITVVNKILDVNWIICRGGKTELDASFINENVKIYGYVEEGELRNLMANSDLSINILEDTVGSNVITTSMAMGLGIIVSDVGSIKDYCGDDNAVFCKNSPESFINNIQSLICNQDRINEMKKASLRRSIKLSVNFVDNWFSSI